MSHPPDAPDTLADLHRAPQPDLQRTARAASRRRFLESAASGTLVVAFGGAAFVLDDGMTREARAAERKDGRPRLPPGQRVITALRPMGGTPGDPRRSQFRLQVHGDVEAPFELDFHELLKVGS